MSKQYIHKIVIADRSPLYREGLKITLAGERRWQLEEVDSIAGLIAYKNQASQRDLIIIDGAFFQTEAGVDVSNFISVTPASVLLLCNHDGLSSLQSAKKFGAKGMVSKASSLDSIVHAVGVILAGHSCWPDVKKPAQPPKSVVNVTGRAIVDYVNTLTPKEKVIVPYLMQGKLYKEIAFELGLQDATIKFHAANILRKMHSHNRTHLVSLLTKVIPLEREFL